MSPSPSPNEKWQLSPLSEYPIQAYIGKHLRAIGICKQVTNQIGACHIWVSSYSTSEDFLRGFRILRLRGMVLSSRLIIDTKAAQKITKLSTLARHAFDHVYLGMSHSKVMLFENDRYRVAVLTSMNQTYGSRAESTVFFCDDRVFAEMKLGMETLAKQAMEYGLHTGADCKDRGTGGGIEPDPGHFRPFGSEW